MSPTHPWINQWPEDLDFSKQSFPVPGTQRPGQTSAHRHLPCMRHSPADTISLSLPKVPTEAVRLLLFRSRPKPNPSLQPCSPTSPWMTWNTTGLYPKFSKVGYVPQAREHSSSVTGLSNLRNLSSLQITTSGRHGERSTREDGMSGVPSKVFSSLGRRSERTGSTRSGFGPRISLVGLPLLALWPCDFPESSVPVDCRSRSHLIAHPSTEWQIVDLATSLYGKALVPLYDNFGPDSIGG